MNKSTSLRVKLQRMKMLTIYDRIDLFDHNFEKLFG